MRMYITRINGVWRRDPSVLRQHLTADAAHQLGFREMGIYRYQWPQESKENLSSRLDGIIAGINRGDPVIFQLPTGNGLKFDAALADRIRAYGGRLGFLIHEVEPLLRGGASLRETANLYNQAEVLIVPTYAMRERLSESGVRENMKYVVQALRDYPTGEPFGEPAFKREIHFTDGTDVPGLRDWAYPVPLKLMNPLGKEPHQLLRELSEEGGFGLLWYRDENTRRYMELDALLPHPVSDGGASRHRAVGNRTPVCDPGEPSGACGRLPGGSCRGCGEDDRGGVPRICEVRERVCAGPAERILHAAQPP